MSIVKTCENDLGERSSNKRHTYFSHKIPGHVEPPCASNSQPPGTSQNIDLQVQGCFRL